ncbi:uncharacterized protein LOC132178010 [Corylus avellana]|uniref:uncharacterized protein LOC132178010 n=1 Tax=Corylus avellana TaxID=13451 RepID=UPI00286ACB52|nr:uncharacterized protein LOC132178010 [Corylus avellana]
MNTPNIVKVSLWKACHNALATKANLFRRKINEDPLCPNCGVESKTIGHVLWDCPTVQIVWSMCGKIQKRRIMHDNFVIIVEELCHYLDKEEMEVMVVVARSIWLRRNALVHGKKVSPSNVVVKNAIESFEAYHIANSKIKGVIKRDNTKVFCWEAPKDDFVKVNWDAAVDKHRRKMGIGVIIRDSMGEVLTTLSAPKDYIIEPDIAEALVVLRAVLFCGELGFHWVILEGDALQVV